MQIIIPMSGFGERFRRAGYSVPKPLIQVEGKPIIAHVIDMFPGELDFTFICNEDHLANPDFGMEQILHELTPSLFPPESNKKYKIEEFWGPYIQWSDSPDLIIFGSINTPRGRSTPSDSPEYKSFLMEREGYAKHVVERGGSCVLKPCFEKALLLPNGGEILVLVR